MSSDNDNTQTNDDLDTQDTEFLEAGDELAMLKNRADLMGLKYHPSISADKLKERIQEASQKETAEVAAKSPAMSKADAANLVRAEAKMNALKLVRCRITCMNPNKRDWEGEIFSAGNSVIGTVKKFVPFNEVWHVPQIIFNMIKERQCQIFVSERTRIGSIRRPKLIKEFGIEILPDLTAAELKDLAQRQAMAAGTAEA
jgi:hypothetical protein